jgi:protein-tyrosine-phosphatase
MIVGVPVSLVDGLMPALKDTELRVLLCVLRQTRVIGRERDSAWLTHTELCRRTGRASEAVSAATAALTERGLLEVLDERGNALTTTRERQLAPGRRYYRVSGTLALRKGAGKPKTKESDTNRYYCFRFSETRKEYQSVPNAESSKVELPDPLTREQKDRIEAERRRIRERLARLPQYPSPKKGS